MRPRADNVANAYAAQEGSSRYYFVEEGDQSRCHAIHGQQAQDVTFVGHIKRLNVFASSFEAAFQPLAALGFPDPVLKTVDEQNRRVAALNGNRRAGNKVFSFPKPCSDWAPEVWGLIEYYRR